MTGTPLKVPIDVANVAHLEDQLAASLHETATELDHTDCFDDEQRAEMFTILRALSDDTAAHRLLVGRWVSDRPRGN